MTYTHAIIYTGAPYGDGESGHIVSRHKSRRHAENRFDAECRDSEGNFTTFDLSHEIVALDANGDWTRIT